MMDYDKYLSMFDSDPEDDDDPDIKRLKYNALFAEEDGFVIVLPDFKPYRYNIEPAAQPPKPYVRDSGLQQHDRVVGSMKEMTLAVSHGKDYHSSATVSAAPSRHYNNMVNDNGNNSMMNLASASRKNIKLKDIANT